MLFVLLSSAPLYLAQVDAQTQVWLSEMVECPTLERCEAQLMAMPNVDLDLFDSMAANVVMARFLEFEEAGYDALNSVSQSDQYASSSLANAALFRWPEQINSTVDAAQAGYYSTGFSRRVAQLLNNPDLMSRRDDFHLSRDMRDRYWGYVLADRWSRIALDEAASPSARSDAAKALYDISVYVFPFRHRLASLGDDTLPGLTEEQSYELRVAAGDPEIADDVAAECMRQRADLHLGEYEQVGEYVRHRRFGLELCMQNLISFGWVANEALPIILPLLEDEDRQARILGIEAVGALGGVEALPAIEYALESDDWREVEAAIIAYGRLAPRDQNAPLHDVAAEHWFNALRQLAGEVITERLLRRTFDQTIPGQSPAAVHVLWGEEARTGWNAIWLLDVDYPWEYCSSEAFGWNSNVVRRSAAQFYEGGLPSNPTAIPQTDGQFLAINHGEWGGSLVWEQAGADPIEVLDANISYVVRLTPTELFVFTGLAHMGSNIGSAYRLYRADEGWLVDFLDELPSQPFWAGQVDESHVGVRTREGFFVLDSTGIEGMADCVPGAHDPEAPELR